MNVSKFANQSPFLLTTCSFDCSTAIWDIRTPHSVPVMKRKCQTPLVTTIFSSDDTSILVAGQDNYVEDIDVRTGKGIVMKLERKWLDDHYCRAYYCNGDNAIVVANTEELSLHVARRFDGKRVIDCYFNTDDDNAKIDDMKGFISVRSDPFNDFSFTAIAIDQEFEPFGLYNCSLV